jgi:hypothetical protein
MKASVPRSGKVSVDLVILQRLTQYRTIWADAICINQTDTSEKNIQVRQMSNIYASADQVIIYVGDYEEGPGTTRAASERAIQIIKNPEITTDFFKDACVSYFFDRPWSTESGLFRKSPVHVLQQ